MARRSRGWIQALEDRTLLSFSTTHVMNLPGAKAPIVTAYLQGPLNPIDLIAGSPGEANILLGNGDGTFAVSQSIPLPANPAPQKPFLVGAFNGSSSDIVLLSQASITLNGLVSYETNNGNGLFSTGPTTAIVNNGAGFQPLSATTADFNGDNKTDLAVIGKATSSSTLVLAILTSNGDGTFKELADYPITGSNAAGNLTDEPLVTGTFNGHVGLALLDGSTGKLDIFLGDGSGNFTQQTAMPVSGSLITAGVFTSSGNTDLVIAGGQTITPYLGNSDGTFNTGTTITTTAPITALASADFDLDGHRDLVTNLGVMLGNGDGTFGTASALPININGGTGTSNTLIATDINHDGKPDIAGFDAGGNAIDVAINSTLAATAVSVVSSQTPANPGSDVQFTSSVSASSSAGAKPTGSVSFFDGNTLLGSVAVGSDGKAVLDAGSNLSIGLHAIHVAYSGDSNFAASNSSILTQAILAATTTTLVSSKPVSNYADVVTFTATIGGSDPNGDQPGGSVTFGTGSSQIGTAYVTAAGTATFSTAAIPAGRYSIQAVYSGDDNFASSTSAAITQTVNTPALEPETVGTTLPSGIIAGTRLHRFASITVTNTLASRFTGPVTINLFAALNDQIDSQSVMIASQNYVLHLPAQKATTLRLMIPALPANLAAGDYLLLAQAVYNGAIDTSNSITGPAANVVAPVIALSENFTTTGLSATVIAGVGRNATALVTLTDNGNIAAHGAAVSIIATPQSGGTGIVLGQTNYGRTIPAGGSRQVRIKLALAASLATGEYILSESCIDQLSQVTNASNGTPIVVQAAVIQLAAAAQLASAATAAPGSFVRIVLSLTNSGNVPATGIGQFAVELIGTETVMLQNQPRGITVLPQILRPIPLRVRLPANQASGSYSIGISVNLAGQTVTATIPIHIESAR